MDDVTKERFKIETQRMLDRSPRYVWGGADPDVEIFDTKKKIRAKGVDCSGMVHYIARRAGLLVSRTTARNMELGRCGWDAVDVELRDSEDLDIWWWTFPSKPDRINGHVGIAHGHKDGWPAVVHASQSRGRVVSDPIKGWVLNDLTALRRLE